MGTALIKIKIMPESPKTDLEKIKSQTKQIVQQEQGKNTKFETEPVAFGLNAIITIFARDETLDSDEMLEKIQNIKHVNSAEIIDFRRALG